MERSSSSNSGNSVPPAWDSVTQTSHISQNRQLGQAGRSRGRGRSRGAPSHIQPHQQSQQPWSNSYSSPPPAMDSFPPLGSSYNPVFSPQAHRPQDMPTSYQVNTAFNSRGPHPNHRSYNNRYQPQQQNFAYAHNSQSDGRRRSPPASALLHHHNNAPSPKQHHFRQQIMRQSDFLNELQRTTCAEYQLRREEQVEKEAFRKALENTIRSTLSTQFPDILVDDIRLKCYGSLNNGFGLKSCDMDLLLALPQEIDFINPSFSAPDSELKSPNVLSGPAPADGTSALNEDKKFEIARLVEGALLDAGLGARLLTKTRVPILRVCEKPGEKLLSNLKYYRTEQLEIETSKALEGTHTSPPASAAPLPPTPTIVDVAEAISRLDLAESAAEVPIPENGQQSNVNLEYGKECGIQCDINFSNFVAIQNTRLLREYCMFDPRVAQIGVFVKAWAKLREINTPYLGTLSSYGYVMMVLHYLMNVVQPPIIPNLQQLAGAGDGWSELDLSEGQFDTRFMTYQDAVSQWSQGVQKNRQSTGHLLRGFFWYYADRQGFNFVNDVISIRTPGGIVSKQSKGWTGAKWAPENKNVRQRYLIAIEDPFETSHNIGRVVGHNGILAIRDEFRRAWNIISQVGVDTAPSEYLLTPVENRGDLLKKDQDHRREKFQAMKQAAAAKEKEQLQESWQETANGQEIGTWSDGDASNTFFNLPRPTSLTENVDFIQDKTRHKRYIRRRRMIPDSDDEEDGDTFEVKVDERKGVVLQSARGDSSMSATVHSISSKSTSGDVQKDEWKLPEPGFDLDGNLAAWDLSYQDGRYLQWRDTKIRKGTWRGMSRPDQQALFDAHPFDPRRPQPSDIDDYRIENTILYANRPPFPLNAHPGINSSADAIAAGIIKPWLKQDHKNKLLLKHHGRSASQYHSRTVNDRRLIKTEASLEQSDQHAAPPASDTTKTLPNDLTTSPISAEQKGNIQSAVLPLQTTDHTPPANFSNETETNIDSVTEEAAQVTVPVAEAMFEEAMRQSAPQLQSQNLKLSAGNLPVGLPLRWDRRTRAGRWLHRRDTWVRVGTFKEPTSKWYKDLHARFPYDSTMSASKFEALNAELRTHYTFSLYRMEPDIPTVHKRRVSNAKIDGQPLTDVTPPQNDQAVGEEQVTTTTYLAKSPRKSVDFVPPSRDISISRAPPSSVPIKTSSTEIEAMPISAFVRSRRLAFFAQQEQEHEDKGHESLSEGTHNIMSIMKKAGIDQPSSLSRKDFVTATEGSSSTGHVKARTGVGEAEPTSASATTGSQDLSHDSGLNTLDTTINSLDESSKVPLTLYPNMRAEDRPRDEDPSVMPIPREADFKFDTRQMRDLAIIKEGGNGCACEGYEFEIEGENEFTGAGSVNWKEPTPVPEMEGAMNAQSTLYEYGKGDEEGLLGELPGADL